MCKIKEKLCKAEKIFGQFFDDFQVKYLQIAIFSEK